MSRRAMDGAEGEVSGDGEYGGAEERWDGWGRCTV